MRIKPAAASCALFLVFDLTAFAQDHAPVLDAGAISGLGARNVGSAAMSGRISALAGYADASGKITLFVGAASGGVWKSTDGATTFKPVFDEEPVQSIGAIALDPSDPDERLGRHRRILDPQQRLDRRRHLQVYGWRGDMDALGTAGFGAHLQDHRRPA